MKVKKNPIQSKANVKQKVALPLVSLTINFWVFPAIPKSMATTPHSFLTIFNASQPL